MALSIVIRRLLGGGVGVTSFKSRRGRVSSYNWSIGRERCQKWVRGAVITSILIGSEFLGSPRVPDLRDKGKESEEMLERSSSSHTQEDTVRYMIYY